MNSKKKKRHSLPIRMILILLILIAVAVIIFLFQRGFEMGISNPFVHKEKTAASSLVLKQVRDISRLNSIEFIYKSVFPHDMIDSSIIPADLISRYKRHENLSLSELETLSLLGIAAEAGINTNRNDFAVVTIRIKAGFNFEEPLSENSIIIDSDNNSIMIKLPAARITEVIIDDADSSIYRYPDLNVSPENWRMLTSILSNAVKKEAQSRGILIEADKRGKLTIEKFLLSSGFETVIFSE